MVNHMPLSCCWSLRTSPLLAHKIHTYVWSVFTLEPSATSPNPADGEIDHAATTPTICRRDARESERDRRFFRVAIDDQIPLGGAVNRNRLF